MPRRAVPRTPCRWPPLRRANAPRTRRAARARARACARSSGTGERRRRARRSATVRAFAETQRATSRSSVTGSRARIGAGSRSSMSRSSTSSVRPYFATSASPERNSRSDRVRSVSTSATTSRGCENVPTRFLPSGRLTPVLPPIAASTCASSVVGTWMNGTPRMYVEATKPARSPTAPPPSATTGSSRCASCVAS